MNDPYNLLDIDTCPKYDHMVYYFDIGMAVNIYFQNILLNMVDCIFCLSIRDYNYNVQKLDHKLHRFHIGIDFGNLLHKFHVGMHVGIDHHYILANIDNVLWHYNLHHLNNHIFLCNLGQIVQMGIEIHKQVQ
jgi:hypothetical protein